MFRKCFNAITLVNQLKKLAIHWIKKYNSTFVMTGAWG